MKLFLKFNKMQILLLSILIMVFSTLTVYGTNHSVTTAAELKKAIYVEMTARTNLFTIEYLGSETSAFMNNSQQLIKSIYEGDDDYLEWNMDQISYTYTKTENLLKIDFTVKYRTTKAQEAYVDNQVTSILATIIKPDMTNDEKLSAIHKYIVDHVEYDWTLKKYTAYDALYSGKAVCQGYALLMDKMLESVGIKSIIIDGSIPEGNHAWNLVQLDGLWYHVDATNDDINNNKYYLKTDTYMRDNNYIWNSTLFPKSLVEYIEPRFVKVFVDGQEVSFDIKPYINRENRTMVPVRFVSERLGAAVSWNNAQRIVTVKNNSDDIQMTIGNLTVLLNGANSQMDTAAILKSGRTLVPLRFISEYLGASVNWNSANQTVNIYSKTYASL